MAKPLVGIVSKPTLGFDDFESLWCEMHIIDDIRVKLVESGALVVGILPTNTTMEFNKNDGVDNTKLEKTELDDLGSILENLDGVVLQGGLSSASYEVEIARYCIEKEIPILGICAGLNNIIRAAGGSVREDGTGFHDKYQKEPVHVVVIEKNSELFKLFNKENLMVNSIHSWVADSSSIGNLTATAICPKDGTIEAVESLDEGFVMGVKWHPEIMPEKYGMDIIFNNFVSYCKKRKSVSL